METAKKRKLSAGEAIEGLMDHRAAQGDDRPAPAVSGVRLMWQALSIIFVQPRFPFVRPKKICSCGVIDITFDILRD